MEKVKVERIKKEDFAKVLSEAEVTESKKAAKELLDKITDVVTTAQETLEVNQKVAIGEAITITKLHKEARTGRNPKSGEEIEIPAQDVFKIELAKAYKKAE